MTIIDGGHKIDKEKVRKKLKRQMENMDVVNYPLRIPRNLHKKVMLKSLMTGTTLRKVLINYLKEWVVIPYK